MATLTPPECLCNPDTIALVHGYLAGHFPAHALSDFHAPTRLMQAGLPMPHADHHVVRLDRAETLPYYAVLIDGFLRRPHIDIPGCLRQWDLASMLSTHRIVIVDADRVSSL